MKVTFEPVARDELDRIYAWLADRNPSAADLGLARIEEKVMLLAEPGLALMGRPGAVLGTRELVEPPYLIVYKVDREAEEIVVLSVVHGTRDRPVRR